MWSYRKIIRIPWTAHQTNVIVLQRIRQEQTALLYRTKNSSYFWSHVIRKGELEDLALTGRIPGKCARDAQHFTFINNFKLLHKNPGKLREVAHNRTQHDSIIVHLRPGSAMMPKREGICNKSNNQSINCFPLYLSRVQLT